MIDQTKQLLDEISSSIIELTLGPMSCSPVGLGLLGPTLKEVRGSTLIKVPTKHYACISLPPKNCRVCQVGPRLEADKVEFWVFNKKNKELTMGGELK